MQPTKADPREEALRTILDVLASILIPLEVTPVRLARIARVSFVEACAKQAKTKLSGRPHLAKIAARTGLTRTEVKRIVAGKFRLEPDDQESATRASRVLWGWQNSASPGKGRYPRKLKISGRGVTFESLCRAHSGDIPHTVILEELKSLGKISVGRDGRSVSVVRTVENRKRKSQHLQVLHFVSSILSEVMQENAVLVQRKEKIVASAELPREYVETAITSRLNEFLDQLPEMFDHKKRPKRSVLNVLTLVTRFPKAARSR